MALTLQLLHASDLEGGVDAIDRAPNFAALVETFEAQFPTSTLVLSAGDNFISGPFFNAASLNDVAGDLATAANNTSLLLNGAPVTLATGVDVDSDGDNDSFVAEASEFGSGLEAGSGRVDISIMNLIGFDASAIGNHEFDLGSGVLADLISFDTGGSPGDEANVLSGVDWIGAQFPYLSANLDFSNDSELSGIATTSILSADAFKSDLAAVSGVGTAATPSKIAPATIITVDGVQVGVIGATTQLLSSISSPGETTVSGGGGSNDMTQLASVIQPVINQLEAQGVTHIVLTSHLQQIALEEELAGLLDGVDIIIAGGSDTVLADDEDVSRGLSPGQTAERSYPILTTDAAGDSVAIVSTDGEYSTVGRLVVSFDDNGRLDTTSIDSAVSGAFATTDAVVTEVVGSTSFATDSIAARVQALTTAVQAVVNTQDGNIQGSTDVFLEGRRTEVRTEETNLGNLSADANLAAAQAVDSTVMVSIKNGGGIRAAIGEVVNDGETTTFLAPQANEDSGKQTGQISQLDIVNALRFNNSLTLQTVTADQLLQIVEHAVAETADGATPGQFGQFSGINFSFDPTQPANDRVQTLAITDTSGGIVDILVQNSELVGDASRPIRVVTLNFLQGGGDSYPFSTFAEADSSFANVVQLTDVVTEAGSSTFAGPGTEQDALAEYLLANFSTTAFQDTETSASEDLRIQNLSVRSDAVLGATTLFDESYYLEENPDVAAFIATNGTTAPAGFTAEEHFEQYGAAEGRNPNRWFDTDLYATRNATAIASSGLNAFEHFNTLGWQEGLDPSAAFDTSAYLDANPDVATAGVNPLEHVLAFGLAEGRSVSDSDQFS